jgi:hypothetical protein
VGPEIDIPVLLRPEVCVSNSDELTIGMCDFSRLVVGRPTHSGRFSDEATAGSRQDFSRGNTARCPNGSIDAIIFRARQKVLVTTTIRILTPSEPVTPLLF